MRLAAVITLLAASASAMSPGSVDYAARWIGEKVSGSISPPVTDGLIAWYQFENNLDSSWGQIRTMTNDFAGVLVDMYGTGKYGSAWTSANTNEWRSSASVGEITNYPYSITMWALQPTWGDAGVGYVSLQYKTDSLQLGADSAAASAMRVLHGSVVSVTSPKAPTNEWFHVAIVAESRTNWTGYLNGVEFTTDTRDAGTNLQNCAVNDLFLRINRRTTDSAAAGFADGSIDDLLFYNAALTSNEVVQLYEWSY